MRPEFGIFEPVFETAHGYLALLGLRGHDASESVMRVRDCCRRATDPFHDICRLLTEPNWRPHLVASVAVILCGYQDEVTRLLWHRLDTGSWVTPQIGAALSLIDPKFLQHARERLEMRCPLGSSELMQMTPIERHSTAGPADAGARSAKAAQTLLRLAQVQSPRPVWLDDLVAAPDFQSLLREDIDGSAGITDGWLQRIKELVATQS